MRTKTIFFAIISFIALLSSSLSAQSKAVLTGSVSDAETGEPLAGARIEIKHTNIVAGADAGGHFEIKNLPAGQHTIICSLGGYGQKEEVVAIEAGQTKTISFALRLRTNNLEEVVVTGTGTRYRLVDAPVATEVLTAKDIASFSAPTSEALLQGLSPSFDFGPNLMGSFMQLNGLSSKYILILIDGKRVYGDVGGQADLSRISPDQIERIELVKGASSSLYGSDAIAGVINVITKKNTNRLSAYTSHRISKYNDRQTNTSLDINIGKFSSNTNYFFYHTDGWQNSPFEIKKKKGSGEPVLEETYKKTFRAQENQGVSQSLSYYATNNLSFSGNVQYNKRQIFTPTFSEKKAYDMDYRALTASLGTNYLFPNGLHTLSFDVVYDRFRFGYLYHDKDSSESLINNQGQTEQPTFFPGQLRNKNDQIRYTAEARGVFTLPYAQKLTGGLEYFREELISPYNLITDKADASTLSAYVQDEWKPLDWFNMTAGFRLVHHQEFGTRMTPKVSILAKYGPLNFRATYANGYKTPTLKELFARNELTTMGSHNLYLGNADLKPQMSDYYALGLEYNQGPISFSATVYDNELRNLISFIDIPTSPEHEAQGIKKTKQYANIEKARSRGLDVLCDASIGWGIKLGAGYSLVEAKNLQTDEWLEGAARHRANVHADWAHYWGQYRLGVSLFGRIQSERYYKDGNTPDYTLWRLATSHRFAHFRHIILDGTLGIDNLFDYVDDRPMGVNYATVTPGRTFFAQIAIRFNN